MIITKTQKPRSRSMRRSRLLRASGDALYESERSRAISSRALRANDALPVMDFRCENTTGGRSLHEEGIRRCTSVAHLTHRLQLRASRVTWVTAARRVRFTWM